MNTTIIRTNRRKTTSKGMTTLITLKPVKKKSRKRYAQTGTDFDKYWRLCLAKPSRSLIPCSLRFTRRLHEENHLRFSNSKHFRFYWTKKHFISAWYFTKNHEIGSLVVRTVKRSWNSQQNRERRPASRNCWSFLSPRRVKKLQKFVNLCLKVGHSANLKHSKSTWRQSSCASCEMYKISTSRNGNDHSRQLSFWYRALSCGADWFTKGVYIWETHLHIAVPTVTCSLRYT